MENENHLSIIHRSLLLPALLQSDICTFTVKRSTLIHNNTASKHSHNLIKKKFMRKTSLKVNTYCNINPPPSPYWRHHFQHVSLQFRSCRSYDKIFYWKLWRAFRYTQTNHVHWCIVKDICRNKIQLGEGYDVLHVITDLLEIE